MPIEYLSFHFMCKLCKLQSRLTLVFFSKLAFLALFRLTWNCFCTDLSFIIEELTEASDNDLFTKVQNRIHCLSSLLPHSNPTNYRCNFRPRGHDLSLSSVKNALLTPSTLTPTVVGVQRQLS